jgi:hypothetical protein
VNNKGQSVRSLAISHLNPSTIAAVAEAEEGEEGPWLNYRATHGDGLIYGEFGKKQLT